ncbi:unnamed protein product [Rotaria sp. Silwood1]|nr:unnamed protein product [Rotaria sp. Silwood1]
MDSSSRMTANNSNIRTNPSNFWSNRGYRKRKVDANDFEDKCQNKIFITEEILIKNMQTLSLDLSENKNASIFHDLQDDEEENTNQNETDNVSRRGTRFELHKLLKDNLRKDDLQDSLINKLYDFERKKLSMQIVPYMPIYSLQANNNNNNNNPSMDEKEQEQENQNQNQNQNPSPIIVKPVKKEDDDLLFKRPFPPTPYTVEEPPENTTKRTSKMKRSYSQSVRYNSNLSVIELKNDTNDYSFCPTESDYFIVEPSTPVVTDSSASCSKSILQSNQPSIQITEYFDFPSTSSSNTNNNNNFSKPLEESMSSAADTQIASNMTTPCETTINSSEVPIETPKKKFDLKILRDAFVNCVQPDNTLILSEYVRAYEELCTFVCSLGTVFEWATKDLSGKLIMLREHIRLDPINYDSIQSMILYEIESGRIQSRDTSIFIVPGKPLHNGCRTLLRLHRALAFLSAFLTQMRLAPDDASSATIACNAYSATLAQFHLWPVRYTIMGAIKLTLPSRQELVNKLLTDRSTDEINTYTDEIVQACNTIERTTQELFKTYNLTKLP